MDLSKIELKGVDDSCVLSAILKCSVICHTGMQVYDSVDSIRWGRPEGRLYTRGYHERDRRPPG